MSLLLIDGTSTVCCAVCATIQPPVVPHLDLTTTLVLRTTGRPRRHIFEGRRRPNHVGRPKALASYSHHSSPHHATRYTHHDADAMSSSLSPRPAPPNEQVSSRTLHPIYQAVDTRNYTKALKLTAPSQPHSEWDIVKALRVHALERSGKKRDALVLVWELLTSSVADAADDPADVSSTKWKEVYAELFERIVELSDVEDVMNAPKGASLDIQLISGIERLDRDSLSPLAMPEYQDKFSAPPAPPSSKSKSKGGKKGKAAKQPAKGKTSSQSSVQFPPITDETVLQTLSVTLQIEGLHDTMSEIYHRATEYLSKSQPTENYLAVLEESIAVHYRAVSCCSAVGSIVEPQGEEVSPKFVQAQLSKLQTLQRATRFYDRIQSCSLQLAKATSQPLHFQWTAISSLWFKGSLQDYAGILQLIERAFRTAGEGKAEHSASMTNLQRCLCKILSISGLDEVSTLISNANQKMALLPRLAESLSSRIVLNPSTQPSENDWDVYLETLLVQGKRSETIEALQKIQGTPMPGGEDGDSSVMPRIDDEDTIDNHVGSLLPYTQRKKFERLATISFEMDRFDASAGYYKELLGAFPDQWSYWQGLIECCVKHGTDEVDDDGWTGCCEFTKEVIVRTEATQKYALRGPHICLLELALLKAGKMKSEDSLGALSRELRVYGDKFGPIASCCFSDMRSYIDALIDTVCQDISTLDDLPLCVSGLLCWAKETHTSSTQSASTDENVDSKQRRMSLRRFIFGVQVVYGIAAKLVTVGSQIIDEFSPPITTLVVEWRMSLSYLPGVAPKDGGQKEVLPGDEIMLLASQALQYRAATQLSGEETRRSLLQAAALLEEAIDHSPFNPHLKIAAIGVYAELNVAYRALTLYEDLGIKQIQIDSCSYLILTVLVGGGLYTSAIKHSSGLLKLHCSASRDIKDFSVKALRNGLFFKSNEMITFQRDKMRNSLQLLNSKGLIMDCAPLFMPADFSLGVTGGPRASAKGLPFKLGSDKGLVGGDEDARRAERNAQDARSTFNAPSVILAPAQSGDDLAASDNRDFSVGSFETIHRRPHPSTREVVADSLRVGHMHGFMTRAVLLAANASGPKKGKPPKLSAECAYHCESLDVCLKRAREFEGNAVSETAEALWRGSLSLGSIMMTLIRGKSDSDDSLASRESAAVLEIGVIVDLVEGATLKFRTFAKNRDGTDVGREVCNLLPSFVVPFYAMLGTTSKLFDLFSWGKRKRTTRPASGSLATLALSFRGLLTALCDGMERFRSTAHPSGSDLAGAITPEMMERVEREVRLSRDMTRDRVDPFLQEMIQELSTYDVDEST